MPRYRYKWDGEEFIAFKLPDGNYRTTHWEDQGFCVNVTCADGLEPCADPIPDPETKFVVEVHDAEFGVFIVTCSARNQDEAGLFVAAWLMSLQGGKATERTINVVDHEPLASLIASP
jgi:hypothetical protein